MIKGKFSTKYRRRNVVKGKGLFDVRRTVARMRVLTGGGHLAFQSTAASGRQCTTARRLRNSLSRTGTGCLSYPDILCLRTSCSPAVLDPPFFHLSFEHYLDSRTRLVIAIFTSEKTITRANIQQHVDASAGHPSRRAQEEDEADQRRNGEVQG